MPTTSLLTWPPGFSDLSTAGTGSCELEESIEESAYLIQYSSFSSKFVNVLTKNLECETLITRRAKEKKS